MSKTIPILFVFLIAFNVQADCRGCCSRHGGAKCMDGTTLCNDDTPLSYKCQQKSCNKCSKGKATTKYNRKNWPHWIDEDGDCQNTRAEILIRDNVGKLKFNHCTVVTGKWVCPYTGKIFFKASDVDIDHIVPLSHAFKVGASGWPRAKKRRFANDPLNLLAVEDNTNQAKGDKAPNEWKPPRREHWKAYARRWRAIKKKYGLKINKKEKHALQSME